MKRLYTQVIAHCWPCPNYVLESLGTGHICCVTKLLVPERREGLGIPRSCPLPIVEEK